MLGQSNDFCAWSLDCNTGIDAAFGLSIQHPFFAYEVQNYSTPDTNIIDRPLYHSPQSVHKASVGSGETRTVSFDVYDRNYLFNTDVLTPLPQFVKFEADGQLSTEYGIAQNGSVTVDWTPTDHDVLYAKLYDIEGNVMAWDTVRTSAPDDWVDLGLPSGLLWANRNVGADTPEEYGNYYAWGETQPKAAYSWSNYQHCNGGYSTLTKYCTNSEYSYTGYPDNLTILLPEDDAATANWGDGARMPTKEEWQELMNNCTSVWISTNNVNGRLLTGPNGNTLFLPAAGYHKAGNLLNEGNLGHYWSSSLYTNASYCAWYFNFDSSSYDVSYGTRYFGRSVRAVRSASQK